MTALSPPKPAELRYAVTRLSRETGANRTEAERAYQQAGFVYDRAAKAIQIDRQRQAERDAERRYQQQILSLRYFMEIRPALRRWTGWGLFDPLQNPADAYCLIEECYRRGFAIDPTATRGGFTLRLATPVQGGRWRSGEGVGDNLREALVLAWWQAFQEDEAHG